MASASIRTNHSTGSPPIYAALRQRNLSREDQKRPTIRDIQVTGLTEPLSDISNITATA
jgi:hypothetical protein